MKLKRRNVVSRSSPDYEKMSEVKRTAAGRDPWNQEAETLRWTKSEIAEIKRRCARLGWTYTDFINDQKRFYYLCEPIYEAWCLDGDEKPTDEGFMVFLERILERREMKLEKLAAQCECEKYRTMH